MKHGHWSRRDFQGIRSAVTILDVGAVHQETDHQADGINDDMAVAALGPKYQLFAQFGGRQLRYSPLISIDLFV
jgi:hypothetical protein